MYCAGRAQSCFLGILGIPASLLHLVAPRLYPIPYILHRGATLCPGTVPIHIIIIIAHSYVCPYRQALLRPSAHYCAVFGANRREGVVQFSQCHAPHTATSSNAITLTKTRMRCIICILDIALHRRITHQAHHTYTSMPVYNRLSYFHCGCARRFVASVLERICNFGASLPKGSNMLPRSR